MRAGNNTLCRGEKFGRHTIPMTPFVALDIDECTNGTHNCSVNAVCNDTRGSYNCTCKDGFHGDGINCNGNYFYVL